MVVRSFIPQLAFKERSDQSQQKTSLWMMSSICNSHGLLNMTKHLRHIHFTPKLLRLIGPLFKSKLWDETPYKQGLPTDPTFIMTGQEKVFEQEKEAVLQMIGRFTEANIAGERHPVFGKLSKENWSKATWKHLDHHLKQFGV